jgi:hypothetical protein
LVGAELSGSQHELVHQGDERGYKDRDDSCHDPKTSVKVPLNVSHLGVEIPFEILSRAFVLALHASRKGLMIALNDCLQAHGSLILSSSFEDCSFEAW